ncbi:ATP-binding cassette sub-family G member 1 isoform X2 [Hyalella azteca]|uniref:ATP-binding cassette sub-family G member 1 isoform X2 n=1 Tax=Hyalella azteca TaxID=294128 RepID=A0A8B7PBX2_HYAAZ|nr:ATP-binding cassette sub-family G member 1 isoform X2 [Hyalella azteca]
MSTVAKRREVNLTVKDLTYWVPDGNKGQRSILKGISGNFNAGQLTAILGPSGSGKTSFMNIAAGCKTRRVSGTILVNGHTRDPIEFRRNSCYITQADHHLPFLTVMEAMKAAASLKLGPRAKKDGGQIIDDILASLRLTDCRNTRINDLSGGETKRLSIALELINNPPVMLFDEPTSGLDSRNSFQCVELLHSLARGGRTIICTLHQPSARIFQMFDQLYALSDGQCIYRGTIHDLLPFLDSVGLQCPPYHNPADFLVEVAVGEYGDLTKKLAAEISCRDISASNDISLDVVPAEDFSNSESPRKSSARIRSLESSQSTKPIELHPSSRDSISIQMDLKESVQKSFGHDQEQTERFALDTVDCEYPRSGPATAGASSLSTMKHGVCVYTVKEAKCGLQISPTDSLLDDDNSSTARGNFPSSSWLQFRVLFHRTFITIIRDMMLTKLRLGAHVVVALLIGLLYYGVGAEASKVMDNTGCLFFVLLFFIFTSMMPTILTFPLEMNVLVREHLNRWYSLKSYYMAKVVADMPFQVIFPLMSVLIVYLMTAQPLELWRMALFSFICILTSLVAQSIGLTIGAAFTVQEAVFLGPASIVPLLLFSGFFIQFSTIPIYMRWITYLSFVRYGFEGVILSIYGFGRENLECSEAFCYLKAPSKILETLDVSEDNIYLDIGMLFVYFLVVRVVGYYVLRWKVRSNR